MWRFLVAANEWMIRVILTDHLFGFGFAPCSRVLNCPAVFFCFARHSHSPKQGRSFSKTGRFFSKPPCPFPDKNRLASSFRQL
jgi:hypothetical protein